MMAPAVPRCRMSATNLPSFFIDRPTTDEPPRDARSRSAAATSAVKIVTTRRRWTIGVFAARQGRSIALAKFCCWKRMLERNSTTRTPATNTGYGHHQRTSSQQFYNKFATSQCQSPTYRHVSMLGCGKFLFVGGVRSRCS